MSIAKGIQKTKHGFRAFVRVHGRLIAKSFPPNATIAEMKAWRDQQRRLRQGPMMPSARGTLREDARRYLKAVAAMPSIVERQRDLEAWLPTFGQRSRWSMRTDEIRAQLAEWKASGLAASTVNHRRTALSHLYTVLDGKTTYNPVKDVPAYPEPPRLDRGVSYDILSRILDALVPTRKTTHRLRVLAWTGLRPSELMRLQPAHVDLKTRILHVPTAKGGPPRVVALNRAAVVAVKAFVAADAFGPFSLSNLRRDLHAACAAIDVATLRVYDLRHSHGRALRAAGADLADVAVQLGHADTRMTLRYAPTVTEKVRKAVNRLRPVKVTPRNLSPRKQASASVPERVADRSGVSADATRRGALIRMKTL